MLTFGMRARTLGFSLAIGFLAAATARAETEVKVGGGVIVLTVASERSSGAPSDAAILDWVNRAAGAVSAFYGHFPVTRVEIRVARVSGRRISGTTYGSHLITMQLGDDASPAQLANDWTLTHEMFHLAFPDLDRKHLWMEEGMATYFEPIARARVSDMPPDRLWRELFEGLPKGLPQGGDRGLDQTPTWGRTYWGGTLFWFLADLEIRERTQNRHSADDAIRAVLAAGGHGDVDWPIERVLEVGDRGTGTTVLASLYKRMATHPYPVDVDALAAKLGVRASEYDDKAPESGIRRAITSAGENPGNPLNPR
jgi:hypothetical protein